MRGASLDRAAHFSNASNRNRTGPHIACRALCFAPVTHKRRRRSGHSRLLPCIPSQVATRLSESLMPEHLTQVAFLKSRRGNSARLTVETSLSSWTNHLFATALFVFPPSYSIHRVDRFRYLRGPLRTLAKSRCLVFKEPGSIARLELAFFNRSDSDKIGLAITKSTKKLQKVIF